LEYGGQDYLRQEIRFAGTEMAGDHRRHETTGPDAWFALAGSDG
jgi:hypothetical protein